MIGLFWNTVTPFSNNSYSCAEIHTSSLNLPKISNTKTTRNLCTTPEKGIITVDIGGYKELDILDTEKKVIAILTFSFHIYK